MNMQIQISSRFKMLGVPYRVDVANLFPQAQKVGHHLAVPHTPVATRMLRNLGFDCPAPILVHYDWAGGTPYEVQKKTCAMLTTYDRGYNLNGMGTGKTKCQLWAFDYLQKNKLANKMLVVAPVSTLNFTWARECLNTVPHLKVSVLYGTREKRLKRLSEDADIYIINHDGIATMLDALKARTDIDVLCLDEMAVYRNGQSARTKTIRKFAQSMKWVWGMTGSPAPQGPTDVWAQATVITPHTVNKSFTRFREELMLKVSTFKWAPKANAIEKAFEALQPSVRFQLDDILELPELVERTVDIDLGPDQKRVYTAMEQHAQAAVANHTIDAMNAGAVLNKLLQISTGWVYGRDGSVAPLDNKLRLDALVDAINGTDRKVIVFVPFKHALAGIGERLTDEGIDHALISGDTPQGQRSSTFTLFQNTGRIRVLVAHPQCMAHGVTLTAADTIIWFAPITSLEIFEQANARIRRVGQKHKQQVLMFQSTRVEKKLYAGLRSKQKVQNMLLDLFAEASA